jgi:hypothetical protein
MTDDSSSSGAGERKRIDIASESDVRDWSQRFRVTPERLKEAIKSVGDSADAVWQFLQSSHLVHVPVNTKREKENDPK